MSSAALEGNGFVLDPWLSISTGKINDSPTRGGLCRGGKQHEFSFDSPLAHIHQLADRPKEKIPPPGELSLHACGTHMFQG